jgi:four helix bundle protein
MILDFRFGYTGMDEKELLGTVLEEADECCYWIELISDGQLLPQNKIELLYQEANELTAIIVASIRTVKGKNG